jgi:hypothetical protein
MREEGQVDRTNAFENEISKDGEQRRQYKERRGCRGE